jgi:hypothetical protein
MGSGTQRLLRSPNRSFVAPWVIDLVCPSTDLRGGGAEPPGWVVFCHFRFDRPETPRLQSGHWQPEITTPGAAPISVPPLVGRRAKVYRYP